MKHTSVFGAITAVIMAATMWGLAGSASAQDVGGGSNVQFVLDASGSMSGAKLDTAKAALNSTAARISNQASTVGVRAYGSGSCDAAGNIVVPLGAYNRGAFESAVNGVSTLGLTFTTGALKSAAGDLGNRSARNIVLVTDGADNCNMICDTARDLAARGIRLQTIGVQVNGTTRAELQCAANATGGQYFDVSNIGQINVAVANAGQAAAAQPAAPAPAPTPPATTAPPTSSGGGGMCNGLRVTIRGTSGDDVIRGTAGRDVIAGGPGNDTIYGLTGDDVICGGGGHDMIFGGDGNDLLRGDTGNDQVFGGAGYDEIAGGRGDDTLRGDVGNDTVRGGAGNDDITGGAGNDRLLGNRGWDTMHGGSGNDVMSGGTGNDRVNGNQGHDITRGGNGTDACVGETTSGCESVAGHRS